MRALRKSKTNVSKMSLKQFYLFVLMNFFSDKCYLDECKLAVVVGVSAEQSSEGEDKQKFSKKVNDFYSIFALKNHWRTQKQQWLEKKIKLSS